MGTLLSFRHHRHHRKLPAELNREIYLCFSPATQRKFIWGLGWNFYAMFRHRLLTKTKRVRNPQNRWNRTNTRATVAEDGLNVHNNTNEFPRVFAVYAFLISGPHCRLDEFPGTLCYYYEVKVKGYLWCYVGLSDDSIPVPDNWVGTYPNSYAIRTHYHYYANGCYLAGRRHCLKLPEGAIQPRREYNGSNVFGCGLVLDPENKLWIFFTLNGKLLGRKIPISSMANRLFPAVSMGLDESIEANFGDDPAKPFEYDIKNCPGLELACI